MTSRDAIETIESCHVRVDTPRPMSLGGIEVKSRDFVFVKVTTEDGLEGFSYALSRGAPIDVVLSELLYPRIIGRSSSDIDSFREQLDRALPMLGMVGLVNRAYSLLDIALWDLAGKRERKSVYELLGPGRRDLTVLLVAPLREPEMAYAEYADSVATLVVSGVSHLKLYPESDVASTVALVSSVREVLPPHIQLVLDAAWRWRSADDVVEASRAFEPLGLAWLEDPLPLGETTQLALARERGCVAIGAGDEASVPHDVRRAIDERAVDILRLDATSIGGLTAIRALTLAAESGGIPVSTHVYPEIHRHVALSLPGLPLVETFGPMNPYWGLEQLMDCPSPSELTSLPRAPGLGMNIDWTHIQTRSFRRLSSG